MRGLYIHVPFCSKKCGYCDFASYEGRADEINLFIAALSKEAAFYSCLAGTFDTVYIGGGTPSLLTPEQIRKLYSAIFPLIGKKEINEFTFEANPESVTEEKAAAMAACGANRISMGLQSHNPELLQRIGRRTSPEQFLAAWDIFRCAGFRNMSSDLMTGLPGQTNEDFRQSLDFLTSLAPEHISLYPLEVHEETPLGRSGTAENPDGAADMYEMACKLLPQKGYERYEISNFAKQGKESRHNMHYWLQEEYLGLGPAAASYINGERRTTDSTLENYIRVLSYGKLPECSCRENLSGKEKDAEKLILGLRLAKGIEIEHNIFIEFKKEFTSMKAKQFLEIEENSKGISVKIKPGMEYMANIIFLEFL